MRPNHGLILFLLLILLVLTPLTFFRKHNLFQKSYSTIPITLFAKSEGKIYSTDLENYLIGVVSAEMPANFSSEALKAQAVAARTIAVQRLHRYGGRGTQQFSGVDFTDDPAENQAWVSITQLKAKWSNAFQINYRKIAQAVYQTSGIIMTYDNQPIDAVFHSTCAVGTADAADVWRHKIPYLQSTSCGCDSNSPRYQSSTTYHWIEIAEMLKIPVQKLSQIRILQRSKLGRVIWISIDNKILSGEDFRKALHLNSTCFTWNYTSQYVTFKVIGYGHGVGMCQYGANGFAKAGWNYRQILRHYYHGIEFCKIYHMK